MEIRTSLTSLRLDRVFARTSPTNHAAIFLARGLGMVPRHESDEEAPLELTHNLWSS